MVLVCYLASIAVLIRTKCDLFQCFHWAQALLDLYGELPSSFPCFLFPNASVGRVRTSAECKLWSGEEKCCLSTLRRTLKSSAFLLFLEKPMEYFCSLNFVKAQECRKKTHKKTNKPKYFKNGNWMATKPFISVFFMEIVLKLIWGEGTWTGCFGLLRITSSCPTVTSIK